MQEAQWSVYPYLTQTVPVGLEHSLPSRAFPLCSPLPPTTLPTPGPLHSSSDVTDKLFADWLWACVGKSGWSEGLERREDPTTELSMDNPSNLRTTCVRRCPFLRTLSSGTQAGQHSRACAPHDAVLLGVPWSEE